MTNAVIFRKEVSVLPAMLKPNTMYAVRTGAGFDLYLSDMTGSIAHKSNSVASTGTGTTTIVSEDEMVYSKRVDFITEGLLYKGEAVVGSSETDAVWRIRKIVIGVDGDVTETWADGSANFSQVWSTRSLATYY